MRETQVLRRHDLFKGIDSGSESCRRPAMVSTRAPLMYMLVGREKLETVWTVECRQGMEMVLVVVGARDLPSSWKGFTASVHCGLLVGKP